MIVGIGNDIVELERIKAAVLKERFLTRYFTEEERRLFDARHGSVATISGNFCVKEAVSKALGTGIRGFGLQDIEVLRDDLGKPYVRLYNQAKTLSEDLGIHRWHVSISHGKTHATAVAIGERA